jgi:hypothetical protein
MIMYPRGEKLLVTPGRAVTGGGTDTISNLAHLLLIQTGP